MSLKNGLALFQKSLLSETCTGDDVASITVDVIFPTVVIDVINVYLAVDVTTVDVVFFATANFIVATVAVALITVDPVSLVITVILELMLFAMLLLMLSLMIFLPISFLLMFISCFYWLRYTSVQLVLTPGFYHFGYSYRHCGIYCQIFLISLISEIDYFFP